MACRITCSTKDSFGPTTRRFLDGHITYSEMLAKNGYTLGMCGKWHMGDDAHAATRILLLAHGAGRGGTYRDPEFVNNGGAELTGFKSDLVTDGAIEFLGP